MITDANVRDTTFLLSSLRAEDKRELLETYGELPAHALAAGVLATPYAYQCNLKGQPAIVFGAHAISSSTVQAWAFGSDAFSRAAPQVTRFVLGPLSRQLIADGYRWAEARSVEGHESAHRWITGALGAHRVAELADFGHEGSTFVLFRRRLR